jgi:hypothetical protein
MILTWFFYCAIFMLRLNVKNNFVKGGLRARQISWIFAAAGIGFASGRAF